MRPYELRVSRSSSNPLIRLCTGVDVRKERLESEPDSISAHPSEMLTTPFGALIVERHAIVGMRDLDRPAHRRAAFSSPRTKSAFSARSYLLSDGNDLPAAGQSRVECAEGVGDAAPLRPEHHVGARPVYNIPDEAADHATRRGVPKKFRD